MMRKRALLLFAVLASCARPVASIYSVQNSLGKVTATIRGIQCATLRECIVVGEAAVIASTSDGGRVYTRNTVPTGLKFDLNSLTIKDDRRVLLLARSPSRWWRGTFLAWRDGHDSPASVL